MAVIRAASAKSGYSHLLGPDHPDLSYIDFGLLSLADGEQWERTLEGLESVLVILGGRCDVEVDGQKWCDIGAREDVFGGKATAVYCPANSVCRAVAREGVRIAVCSARANKGGKAALIPPEKVRVRAVGAGTFERAVHDIAVPGNVDGERIMVGETYNPPGRWSSYPPHKHDAHNPPQESDLEEVYYFRVNPSQGFGIQRVYGDGFDETYAVRDGDVVTIARGYHPGAAAPGYELYYLWVLAGEHRIMHLCDDPQHGWVSAQQ